MIKAPDLLKPQKRILWTTKPRNLALAGQGGGKTALMGFISGFFVANIPHCLGMIAANTYGQLSDSTLVRVTAVWKEFFGWEEDTHYVIDKQPPAHFEEHNYVFKSNNNKIFFVNGAVIMLASLDNYKAIDGREIGWAMLDETKDTKEQAVKDVIIGRLREKTVCLLKPKSKASKFRFVPPTHPEAGKHINPLFIFTSPTKEQWITEYFELEQYREEIELLTGSSDKFFHGQDKYRNVVIYSSLHNKKNLPDGYIETMMADLTDDRINLNVHGSPFGKSGNEYYSAFKKSEHVKPCSNIEGFPIHLAFDFNANPYMTGLVAQIVQKGNSKTKLRFTKQYPLKSPYNTVNAVCDHFDNDWRHLCQYGFYYYGDATGKNSLPIAEYKNYFSVVESKLRHLIGPKSRRLLKQNPRHKSLNYGTMGRRDFINKCLKGGFGFDIEIDPSCTELIQDLEFVKEDANGAKKKDKVKVDGITFEKYGHFSDAFDSLICYVWGDWSRDT